MTNYQRTAAWLHACGKEPGNPAHLSAQIGVHIEEFCEFLAAITTDKEGYGKLIDRCRDDLEWFAAKLKSGQSLAYIEPRHRIAALDALCDCDVTGNGVAWLAGFDKDEADRRVLDSNDSKLNADGTAVILPGGKIGKGERYRAPDLAGCI